MKIKPPQLNVVSVPFRLGVLIFLSIVALCAVGFGGWMGISKVSRSVITLQDERLPAATFIGEIRSTTNLLLQLSFEVLVREKQANAQSKFVQALGRKEALGASLDKAMAGYDAIAKGADEGEAWTNFKESMVAWKKSNDELTAILKAMSENDDLDKQVQLFAQYKAPLASWGYVQSRVDLNLASLLALNKDQVEKAREEDTQTIQLAMRFMAITLGVAIVVLLVLAVTVARSITRPLDRLRGSIVSVATRNDFTERAPAQGKDEIAQTAQAFNQLLGAVQTSLRDVLDSAQSIAQASDKVTSASHQAAGSAENQSEAASAMAAAVEQMTVSIAHISESMNETLRRARSTGDAARDGAQVIGETNSEMDKIAATVGNATTAIDKLSSESSNISTILQVIKDVADQTNLLALNAAIEAARAGEQGRGFAVVADEVRKLAERTTASTEAIGKLVVSMQSSGREAVDWMSSVNRQVDGGKQHSAVAVGHIDGIRDSSQHVVASVSEISEAISEQSSTTQSIAQQVETVARLSETNSHTARETEAVAHELDRLSAALREAVSKFRV